MTIDELARKLREAKKAGLPGTTEVVGNGYLGKSADEVSALDTTRIVTVRMDDERIYGKVVDGRGKPKGTERVLRLL